MALSPVGSGLDGAIPKLVGICSGRQLKLNLTQRMRPQTAVTSRAERNQPPFLATIGDTAYEGYISCLAQSLGMIAQNEEDVGLPLEYDFSGTPGDWPVHQ